MNSEQVAGAMVDVAAEIDRTGKYLTFQLGYEDFGLEILKVREIIGLMDITPVPMTPNYVRGVINLRGKVIPVIDLRLKFGMQPTEDHERKCVIVVDVQRKGSPVQMSILVDAVSEVVHIDGQEIEPPPAFGAGEQSQYILGMGKVKGTIKILLDINSVLSAADVVAWASMASGDQNAQAAS